MVLQRSGPILDVAMVRFLSPEWIDAVARAADASDDLRRASGGVRLTVQQRVHDADGDVVWHVRVDDGDVAILPGEAAQADVTFEQDRATAVAVATGELSAQTAFMDGRLRVSGDVPLLSRHRDALTGLETALAGVREVTSY